MESKEEEEGSQRSLSGSPGPEAVAAVAAIEGEEALAVYRPQLVLEGVVALRILLLLMMMIMMGIFTTTISN